jgi:sulfur carrier protein
MVGFFILRKYASGGGALKIILNGKDEIIEDDATIASLVLLKGLNPNTVIVEYNYDLIRREDWHDIALKENDRLEILKFVGGG